MIRALHVLDGEVYGTLGSPDAHRTLVRIGPDGVGIGGAPWVGAQDASGRFVALAEAASVRIVDQDSGRFVDLAWPEAPAPPRALIPLSGRAALLVTSDAVWRLDRDPEVLIRGHAACAGVGAATWLAAGGIVRCGAARAAGRPAAIAAGGLAVLAGDHTRIVDTALTTTATLDAGPARVAAWHGGPVLGAADGTVSVWTPGGDLVARARVDAPITGIAADAGHVYAATADDRLLALDRTTLAAAWGWRLVDDPPRAERVPV